MRFSRVICYLCEIRHDLDPHESLCSANIPRIIREFFLFRFRENQTVAKPENLPYQNVITFLLGISAMLRPPQVHMEMHSG